MAARTTIRLTSTSLLLLGSSYVLANNPSPINIGGVEIAPLVDLTVGHTDNLFYEPDNTVASGFQVLNPSVRIFSERNRYKFLIGLDYTAGWINESSVDNYTHNGVNLGFDWAASTRNHFQFGYKLANVHEPRGTGYSAGDYEALDEPDTYRTENIGLKYQFGAPSAKGRIEFGARKSNREFTSRREITRSRDFESDVYNGTFYWRVGGRTDALVGVRHSEVDYLIDPNIASSGAGTLDSSGDFYFLGLTWEATGKTVGTIRLGQATKNFESPSREDFAGFSWEVEANWSPKTYSTITLNTSRTPSEPDGTGSYIDAKDYSLVWDHKWSSFIDTELEFGYIDKEYIDASDGRSESNSLVSIRANYRVLRWAKIGPSIKYRDKTSNLDWNNYSNTIYAIHLRWDI